MRPNYVNFSLALWILKLLHIMTIFISIVSLMILEKDLTKRKQNKQYEVERKQKKSQFIAKYWVL